MRITKKTVMVMAISSFCTGAAYALEHHEEHHRHLSQAPAGVMGDHVHPKGEWMFSYTYMAMRMDGMRDGTSDLTDHEVLQDFMVTPLRMTMEMHMLGAMYAATDDLTLMLMAPYVKKSMDHKTRMGVHFTTDSEGLGDITFSGLYSLKRWNGHEVHANLGVSAPSGDINENDDTPAMDNAQLPYPMQLGSGTWDVLPGLTYTGESGIWSWGAQGKANLRIGDNGNDYTLGNRYELTSWGSYRMHHNWSVSLRLDGQTWSNIDGNDKKLNPRVVPTADPDLQGGTRLDVLAGLNFYAPAGVFSGNRLAIEAGVPAYENLDGPQMSTQWLLTAGWQYSF